LNLPAVVLEQTGYAWKDDLASVNIPDNPEGFVWLDVPKWYVWEGGFLVLGRSNGFVPAHRFHAVQVLILLDGRVSVADSRGEWRSGSATIIRHDVERTEVIEKALGAVMLVDPESIEGLWLRSALSSDITIVPESRVQKCREELRTFLERPFESMEIGALIRLCVHSICPGAPPARRLDPRVTSVLQAIRSSNDMRISLDRAASQACLSPGRFAHLFKQQVGLPFRRYMLWRKLTRAVMAIARGNTIGAAAVAADFADAAHLTRTSLAMLGVPPSAMKGSEFFEIDPPWSGVVWARAAIASR
jgi:AraC-like DNA-binding protein